jgi:hypothetical protein
MDVAKVEHLSSDLCPGETRARAGLGNYFKKVYVGMYRAFICTTSNNGALDAWTTRNSRSIVYGQVYCSNNTTFVARGSITEMLGYFKFIGSCGIQPSFKPAL